MRINFRRILAAESMRFHLRTRAVPEVEELPEDFDPASERNIERVREEALEEICELFDAAGAAAHRGRLHRDLVQREKRAGTALGHGIALPHVRTMQAKRFAMAFARSDEGLPFRAPDGEPVRLFFAMVSPPFDDRIYLKIYRALGSALLDEGLRETLLHAEDEHTVWSVLEPFQ